MTRADLLAAGSVVLAVAALIAVGLGHGTAAEILISLAILAAMAAGVDAGADR